ncbi:Riboflavin biosynthesis protein ribd [Thalictrum thalictroides]|uniref:Riboflavin biosynthesis protein ribd n=1 Tax=Thalictrum thalictroides TaxID=46969 RepID=A0A7J6URD6_THATH|nr:Riboflavin biosynthesis protein ribd [Thalictrum thalictroides]
MAFSFAAAATTLTSPILCKATTNQHYSLEAQYTKRAAEIADKSSGFTSPHPNFGCVIAKGKSIIGEGYLYAQSTKCAELQAVEAGGELCRGSTAYLNLEPGDCYGDETSISSLIKAGVSRVVVGIRHPLQHLRGKAIRSLRSEGLQVDVLGEELQSKTVQEALKSCYVVNAPLLYRAAFRVPFSVLKYAMTLDGKIAASSGHASWISGKQSRNRVFELRGRSDAVIVGGNTVRRDSMHLHLVMICVIIW